MDKPSIHILCIGNSFSEDTTGHVAKIAKSLGYQPLIGNLYIGGCYITKHLYHLENDLPAYRYDYHDGTRWQSVPDKGIRETILSERWDWISIQHGTFDGVRYSDPDAYRDLATLANRMKALAGSDTKIAFNMPWVGEPYYDHHEIKAFGGNTARMYREICAVMKQTVAKAVGIDRISPTGTAIQNARTTGLCKRLCRDGYHLSYDIGRYVAGLTFFGALSGAPIKTIKWKPQGVSDQDQSLAVMAAETALGYPFGLSHIET